MKILIISSHKWPTRLKRHEDIKKLIALGGFKNIQIDLLSADLGKPEVVKGKITQEWFEKNISQDAKALGYEFAVWQFSKEEGKKWKIKAGLRGLNFRDGDKFGESWVCCDEGTVRKYKDKTVRDEYVRLVAHEIGHEFTRQGYTKLEVHDFDYTTTINKLEEFYKGINTKMKWAKYLPEPYFSNVTQDFAVFNALDYPKSKHHIGVDHGVQGKKDIPIFMPCDGKITRVIVDGTLGNCAVILSQDENWAFRMMHMKEKPKVGTYIAGDQVGIVGKTGKAHGEHLHIDCHKDGVINIAKIKDRESIIKYCVDAHELVSKNL